MYKTIPIIIGLVIFGIFGGLYAINQINYLEDRKSHEEWMQNRAEIMDMLRADKKCQEMGGTWNIDHCLITQEIFESNNLKCEVGPVSENNSCRSNGIKLVIEPVFIGIELLEHTIEKALESCSGKFGIPLDRKTIWFNDTHLIDSKTCELEKRKGSGISLDRTVYPVPYVYEENFEDLGITFDHWENICSGEMPQCFGTFDNGTEVRIQCPDYPWKCGVKSFDKSEYAEYDPKEPQVVEIFPPSEQMEPQMQDPIPYSKQCPENTDWPDAPNRCDMRENYTRTELKNLYDDYYEYKGAEWMEMKKTEMDSVIASGSWIREYYELSVWLGHTQKELPFENINVYLYYALNGQAPGNGWGWYAVDNEFEPVITLYYLSPGAVMLITLIIILGAITGIIFSFKEIGLHPKRKTFAIIGFVLIIVGTTMYSLSIFEIIQNQINKMNGEEISSLMTFNLSILFAIPIALVGIPVTLHGLIQRFSVAMTSLISLGLVIGFIMFIFSRFD